MACRAATIPVDGHRIWVDHEGMGAVTVVFEAGFGNDSTVWSTIEPRIRAAGAQTFVYDRAGMGKSTIDTTAPYSIDNDVHILRTILDRCGVAGPIVMVGHSYGGGMSLVAASVDARIKGVVLVESVAPKVWAEGELDKNLVAMRAQYAEIRDKAPDLAKVAIPWAEALTATMARIDAVPISTTLPIIDIVADKARPDATTDKVWRRAHDQLTANQPHRELVIASGSSHKVMADKPDLVVDAIQRIMTRLR